MHLGHIELFVKDPLRSKDFYINILDFEVINIQINKFVWLRSGQVALLLRPGHITIHADEYEHTNVTLIMYSDDLLAAAAHLEAHGLDVQNEANKGYLTFTDPDGNWLQVVNPAAKSTTITLDF